MLLLCISLRSVAETKYWRGSNNNQTGTDWNTAANWSPSGVPLAGDDIVIGDVGMNSGRSGPIINDWNDYSIKSLTIGKDVTVTFTMAPRSMRVAGNVTIGSKGTLTNIGAQAYYSGSFIVETGGQYVEEGYSENNGKGNGSKVWAVSEFLGTGVTIKGLANTANSRSFGTLKITGSVILESNLALTKTNSYSAKNGKLVVSDDPELYVTGTLNPGNYQIQFVGSRADVTFDVAQSAVIHVKKENFIDNYTTTAAPIEPMFPTALNALAVVNYSGLINQNILSARQYGVLRISGGGVKSLSVNTTVVSDLFVDAATLDIASYTLDRTALGGTMNVANLATLRLSASNFPTNYLTVDLGPTSTVEYYGGGQTVTDVAKGYGNLHLIGNGIKTMPLPASSAPLVIAGNLVGAGSAQFTARSNINIAGNVDLSVTASFKGSSFTHTVGGNWINNADFESGTSTVLLTGTGKKIERTSTTALSATLRNEFYNLQVAGLGTIILTPTGQNLSVKGNLSTTGAGTLTQSANGLIMEKNTGNIATTISGVGITLNNLTINNQTSTTASFLVNGNFLTNSGASFTATGGTITFGSLNKSTIYSITNSGTTQFFALNIARLMSDSPIEALSSFSISSDLSGNNLKATAGTVAFNGNSTFGGEHHLFNVAITGTLLKMAAGSVMGVKSTFTGTNFDATAQNTVIYNGAAQNLNNVNYYHLRLSTSSGAVTKAALNAITALGNITIDESVTFTAGNYTHTLHGNWINNGALSAGTSTFIFAGAANTTVTGVTTFNIIRIVKSDASNFITLNNDITTTDLHLSTGFMKTGANKVIMLGERYDNGWVEGTITRTKASGFDTGKEYLFNGPYVSVNFGTITEQVTEVSVTSNPAIITFSGAIPVNRLYRVQTNGAYTKAKLRLQYEDSELNGNTEKSDEDGLKLSYSDSYPVGVSWSPADKKLNDYQANWVEDNGVTASNPNGYTNLSRYWALSDKPNRYFWKGTKNTAWEDAENWERYKTDGVTLEAATSAPTPSDIVELGTSIHNFEPTIGSEIFIKGLQFKPDYNIVLTIGSDLYNSEVTAAPSLTVKGNITPVGTNAQAHIINTGDQKLEARSSLQLDNGQHKININKTAGEIVVLGSINQNTADLNIGAGNLRIQGDYAKAGGTFTTNKGTVTYEGGNAQIVADVSYHHLTINKPGGVAQYSVAGAKSIGGNLTITNGNLVLQTPENSTGELTVTGNVSIANAATAKLNASNTNLKVKGNWAKAGGSFDAGTAIVTFEGAGSQLVSTSDFNNVIFNNASTDGVKLTGNVQVNGNATIQQGKLDLVTYTLNRSTIGGSFTLASGTTLDLQGSDNFPANFNTNLIDTASTVNYSGEVAQNVRPLTYGKLTFTGGGTALPKSLSGATTVKGKVTVNSGAQLNANNQTLTLSGSLVVNGSFSPGVYTAPTPPTGTLILANTAGKTKYITGTSFTVNNMVVSVGAMYALVAPTFTINGDIDITGDGEFYSDPYNPNPKNRGFIATSVLTNALFNARDAKVDVAGNFRSSGILMSNGTAKFLGGRKQTIQLLAPIVPYNEMAPTVEFSGTVAPVFNSTRSPEFADVTISLSNAAGEEIATSVGWTVAGKFIVKPGSTFNGGSYTHKFYSAVVNYGTIKSSGLIDFTTPYPFADAPLAHPFVLGNFESTGTLKLGGTGQILLSGSVAPTLNNLIISNSKGITTTTLNSDYPLTITDWTINGNLTIESTGILNAIPLVPTNNLLGTNFSIKGDLINNGAIVSKNPADKSFIGLGGNFTFTGTNSKISGTGTTMLGSLMVDTNAKLEVGKSVYIYSDLSHKGAEFSTGENTLYFTGPYSSSISTDPANTLSLSKFVVAKDEQTATVTLNTNTDKLLSMVVQKGILDLKTNTVTVHPDITEIIDGAASITPVTTIVAAAPGATIKVGGTSTLPTADVFSLSPTSTAEYYGSSQEVKSVQYGNLALNNTHIATFEDKPDGTSIASIAGNLTVKGESTQSVKTPTTVNFNGAVNQTIAPLAYKNLTLSTGGTKTFAAAFASGIKNELSISGALSSTVGVTVDANDTDVTVNYNGTANQAVLPTDYYNLTLSNTGIKYFSGTTGIANIFTPGAGLADLSAAGNIINFNGSVAQSIPGLAYKNIQVSGAGDKTLQAAASASESVIMGTGIIKTGSHILTLVNTANLVGETNNSYIHGKVVTERTFGATSGNSVTSTQGVAPQGITATSSDFGNIGIQVSTTKDLGTVTVTRETGVPIISPTSTNQSIARNFTFSVSNVSANSDLDASVIFKYLDWELNGLQEPDLRLSSFEDGKWIKQSTAAPDAASNTIGASVKTLTRLTLGSIISPLPVELLSFTAKKNGNNAELKWATASEKNNAGFEVQVSKDGYSYERIGFVDSKVGSSAVKQEYSFTDTRNGKNGTLYYRLKQIDMDGVSKLYGPKAIDFGVIVAATPVQVYPNPFNDKLRLSLSSPAAGIATIKLYTATGKLLKTMPLQVQAGLNENPLPLAQAAYEPGLYLLVIELNGQQQTIKLMKE
ncbi:T9SS type A sorting domain-containing protein [Pontibacter fetidus]|nr:T9SS type A sorting domain-containing protein [Pontibacter fetidus]